MITIAPKEYYEGMLEKYAKCGISKDAADHLVSMSIKGSSYARNPESFMEGFNEVLSKSAGYKKDSSWIERNFLPLLLALGGGVAAARVGESFGRMQNARGDNRSLFSLPKMAIDSFKKEVIKGAINRSKLDPNTRQEALSSLEH